MRASRVLGFLVMLASCGAREPTRVSPEREVEPSTRTTSTAATNASVSVRNEAEDRSHADTHPPAVRMPLDVERAIEASVRRAMTRDGVPGAVVLVGRSDGVVFRRAYGLRMREPRALPMTEDTGFDLASLTKPFTALTTLRVAQTRRTSLDAPVDDVLVELAGSGITLRDLMTHRAGLRSVDPLGIYEGTREERIARSLREARERRRGGPPRYGDLHFLALGAWVERITGERLDVVMRRELLDPWAIGARFGPVHETRCETETETETCRVVRVAATEWAPRRAEPGEAAPMLHGDVNDPRAWRLDGVAGHAGLFGRADDLARLAEALLRDATLDADARFSNEHHAAMRRCDEDRTLGWDCAELTRDGWSTHAFAHGGYTGTWLAIDPAHDLYVIVLANRVHPDGRGRVGDLRSAIARHVLAARDRIAPPTDALVLGVDRVRAELEAGRSRLRGRRVALLTHDAGRTRDGIPTSELLWRAHVEGALVLARIFAPEHGLESDAEGHVADGDFRGIPVTSLFGATRRPTREQLADVDVIVVDVQDVGARFFTYASTVHEVLRAAAEHGVAEHGDGHGDGQGDGHGDGHGVDVLVLDRPNPLGPDVAGPTLDPRYRSFVNHHPLPMRHGATIGELARRIVTDDALEVRLDVLELEGPATQRASWSATGLRWVPPSPNLKSYESAQLYLGVALVEGTNVSVGRGTDAPFERLGAPWIDADALLAALPPIDGVAITTTTFTPTARRYRNERCRGLAFAITDPERFDPLALGEALIRALARTHPDAWDRERLPRMLGDDATLERWLR
ncbi:MAG: DUF1343 domain-containing protein [Myxococcota bacterium]|nr:DUF1343 domain-containing protein [Myxococcota bacterium]